MILSAASLALLFRSAARIQSDRPRHDAGERRSCAGLKMEAISLSLRSHLTITSAPTTSPKPTHNTLSTSIMSAQSATSTEKKEASDISTASGAKGSSRRPPSISCSISPGRRRPTLAPSLL